ncbi:MAG: copper chaperone PCu(A)C [Sphingomonadales bacterium]|nr:copper chaperone PCu(A)C [Sphingomonadales bacterium]MDE2170230.1 copper chaperone PCu(A)C [Sphingomonadales bacterium]
MMSKRAALALIAPLALAACQKGVQPPVSADSGGQAAMAMSDSAMTGGAMTGRAMTDAATATPGGRLVLPIIAGHPAAAYIAWKNSGTAPVTITGITIDQAGKAEMHETKGGAMLPLSSLTLAPGEEANFAPGGRHVMVFDLSPGVKPGDSLNYVLILSDGTKDKGSFKVEKAGADPMAGMHM